MPKRRELAVAFAERGVPIFPVRLFRKPDGRWAKVPCVKRWQHRASIDLAMVEGWWRQWPDVWPAIPLVRTGWVVVDADRHPGEADGVAALAELGPMPAHPVVPTAGGGEHHYFTQPPAAVRGKQAFAPGIDLLGTSRFVVGYALPEGAMPDLPEVFRKRSRDVKSEKGPDDVCKWKSVRVRDVGGEVADLVQALRQLDPVGWRGQRDAWLMLMGAAKFAGIACEDFIAWSVGDPVYVGDAEIIRGQWDSLRPWHAGALWAALSQAGIKVTHHHITTHTTHRVSLPAAAKAEVAVIARQSG
jgi:hypothetical protein